MKRNDAVFVKDVDHCHPQGPLKLTSVEGHLHHFVDIDHWRIIYG